MTLNAPATELNEFGIPLRIRAGLNHAGATVRDLWSKDHASLLARDQSQVVQRVVKDWSAWERDNRDAGATASNVMAFVRAHYPSVAEYFAKAMARATTPAAAGGAADGAADGALASPEISRAAAVPRTKVAPLPLPEPGQPAPVNPLRSYQNRTMREIMDQLKAPRPDQALMLTLVKELLAHGHRWRSADPRENAQVLAFLKRLRRDPVARAKAGRLIRALPRLIGAAAAVTDESFEQAIGFAIHLVEQRIRSAAGIAAAYGRFFVTEADAGAAMAPAAAAAPAPAAASTQPVRAPLRAPARERPEPVFSSAQLMNLFKALARLLLATGTAKITTQRSHGGDQSPPETWGGRHAVSAGHAINHRRLGAELSSLPPADQQVITQALHGAVTIDDVFQNLHHMKATLSAKGAKLLHQVTV